MRKLNTKHRSGVVFSGTPSFKHPVVTFGYKFYYNSHDPQLNLLTITNLHKLQFSLIFFQFSNYKIWNSFFSKDRPDANDLKYVMIFTAHLEMDVIFVINVVYHTGYVKHLKSLHQVEERVCPQSEANHSSSFPAMIALLAVQSFVRISNTALLFINTSTMVCKTKVTG